MTVGSTNDPIAELQDGVEALREYMATSVSDLPVPKEAQGAIDDIYTRMVQQSAKLEKLKAAAEARRSLQSKDATETLPELINNVTDLHYDLTKTKNSITEAFEIYTSLIGSGDIPPSKESFCSCGNRDCYDWDCFENNARRALENAERWARDRADEAARVASAAAAETARLAEEASKVRVDGCEIKLLSPQGGLDCLSKKLVNAASVVKVLGCDINPADINASRGCIDKAILDATMFNINIPEVGSCSVDVTKTDETFKCLGGLTTNAANIAASTATKVANKAIVSTFNGLGLNNGVCSLDEQNIFTKGDANSLKKYSKCMDAAIEKTARETATASYRSIFDGLGLNTPPCILDTATIFGPKENNGMLKYAECKTNQVLDLIPKPAVLGCTFNIRRPDTFVSCLTDNAKTAIVSPLVGLGNSFKTQLDIILTKFRNLLNDIKNFEELILNTFKTFINDIKKEATDFVSKIERLGGEIIRTIKDEAGNIVKFIVREGNAVVQYLIDGAGEVLKIVIEEGDKIINTVKDTAGNVIKTIETAGKDFVQLVVTTGGQMVIFIKDEFGNLIRVIEREGSSFIGSIKDEAGKIITFVETASGDIIKNVRDESGKIISTVVSAGESALGTVKATTGEVVVFLEDTSKAVINTVKTFGGRAVSTILSVGESIVSIANQLLERIKSYTTTVQEIWNKVVDVSKKILVALRSGIVAVGKMIVWLITNGPTFISKGYNFLTKNKRILSNSYPMLIIMTASFILLGNVITLAATSTRPPEDTLFLGSVGATFLIANLMENTIKYLNGIITSAPLTKAIGVLSIIALLKVTSVDILLRSMFPEVVSGNVLTFLLLTSLLGASGYTYHKYFVEETPGVEEARDTEEQETKKNINNVT